MEHKVKISWSGIITITDQGIKEACNSSTIGEAVEQMLAWYNDGTCDMLADLMICEDSEYTAELVETGRPDMLVD